MSKELTEMTTEELWELFPIVLVPHDTKWKTYYAEICSVFELTLAESPIERISHIGSTAVPGIWAKNIVDVLIEASPDADLRIIGRQIENAGFICMSKEKVRMSFNRGYTKTGFSDKVFHAHLRYVGDNDELYFRDYLKAFPQAAQEYERLKMKFWKLYEHDRDAYTRAKTDFVTTYTSRAKELYKGRY